MRVLIIGLGSIARKHIHALKSIDTSIMIYALRSNRNVEHIEDIINIYSFEEINDLNIDFVILSNPTGYHLQYLKELEKISTPLFIEKPLFDTTGAAEEKLVQDIATSNIPTYVACNLRFLDAIIKIREMVQLERVNEVNVYCGSYLPDWRSGADYKTIYSANKEMGGGVHLDLIHELDYIYWIFGKPELTKSTFRSKSSLEITSYDYANYLWFYDAFVVNVVLNYFRKDVKRSLEIVCESGTYCVNLLQNKIYYNNQVVFESKQKMIETYKSQLIFFINKVIKYNDKFNSIDQAYKIMQLCLTD